MNSKLNILILSTMLLFSGCQTVTSGVTKTTDKVKNLVGLGEPKAPEIDQQGVVDVSKATLEKLEQMTLNMPTGQWVYIENDLQGIYTLQNKSADGNMLYFRLNCKIPSQQAGFTIQDKDGKDLLKAHDPQAGQIQFLVDNKNYGNPFDLVNAKKMPLFKKALEKAKMIKIFNNSKLYTFENTHSELLNKPVTCRE
ncbi:MAG: hypothetical protein RR575_03355 [Acinetobacter sp.]